MNSFVEISLFLATNALNILLHLRRQSTSKEDRALLGRDYARLAVLHAGQFHGPERMLHAVEAFRLIDSTADGKRDFSDAQARVFINAELEKKP
jgi:hypothetical protein